MTTQQKIFGDYREKITDVETDVETDEETDVDTDVETDVETDEEINEITKIKSSLSLVMSISFETTFPLLIQILIKRIKAYHTMFSLPLIAEHWEEILSRSFEQLGYKTTWKPDRSHKVGEDMRIVNIENSRISCKSGQFIDSRILGKKCVKFNGSRSTSFPDIKDKIAHFSKSHEDYYFLLAKEKRFDKTYKLLIFPASICKVDQLNWTKSVSGKAFNGDGIFAASIGMAMSAQLWTTLPLDMIPYSYDINCNE